MCPMESTLTGCSVSIGKHDRWETAILGILQKRPFTVIDRLILQKLLLNVSVMSSHVACERWGFILTNFHSSLRG